MNRKEFLTGDSAAIQRVIDVEAFWIRHSMIYHNRGDGFHSDGSADGPDLLGRDRPSGEGGGRLARQGAGGELHARAGRPLRARPHRERASLALGVIHEKNCGCGAWRGAVCAGRSGRCAANQWTEFVHLQRDVWSVATKFQSTRVTLTRAFGWRLQTFAVVFSGSC